MKMIVSIALALSTTLSFAQTQYTCNIYKRLGDRTGTVAEVKGAKISLEKASEFLLPENRKITTDFRYGPGNHMSMRVLFFDDAKAFYASSRVDAVFQFGQEIISAGSAFDRDQSTGDWLQNLWVNCKKD